VNSSPSSRGKLGLVVATGLLSLVLPAQASAASADVAITAVGPSQVIANTDITYHITSINNGPADAPNTSVTDTPPAGTSLVSFTEDSGSPDGSTLAVGQSRVFTLVLHLNSGTARGTRLVNMANVTTTASDPNPTNNAATTTSWVTLPADVAITGTGPTTVTAGQTVMYALSVQNSGPNDAIAVTVTDPEPAGTTFVSLQQIGGPTFTCTPPSAGAGGTTRCYIDTLAAGASAGFTLVVQSARNAADRSVITNVPTVVADPTQNLDANANNDSTTILTTVSNPPPVIRPSVTITGLQRSIKLKALIRSGLKFTESANEAVAFTDTLMGSVRTASLASAGPFNLTLAQVNRPLGGGPRVVKLKPSRKLLGTSKRFTVQVVVTATDASGNRVTTTKTVKVR
jgi:uncharacterized repeat protein (TIGR01451 family)